MRRTASLCVAALVAASLAGCSDDPAPSLTDQGFQDIEVTQTSGGITGVVVDDAIRPVAGATVTLRQTEQETASDDEGRFAFTGLQPGLYTVAVSAPGFTAVQSTADVRAGAPTRIKIVLAADTRPEPYHATLQHRGYMEAWAGTASFLVLIVASDLGLHETVCRCEMHFESDPDPVQFVAEAFWEYTTPDPLDAGQMYFEFFDDGIQGPIHRNDTLSPMYEVIDADAYDADETSWVASLSGPGDWIAVQQDFEMFVTTWYRGPAPAGWSVTGVAT